MGYSGIITIESGKRSGTPCIRSLRITVVDVMSYLAYPADRERRLMSVPA